MNISTKEITRITTHAAQLHFQWADMDSRRQATEAARAAYYAAMAEHDYKQPEKDDNGIVDWCKDIRRRGRLTRLSILSTEG